MGRGSTAIVAIAAATVGLGSGQADKPSPFDRPLQTTEHFMNVPAGPGATPSDASEMGLLSRFARVSSVPCPETTSDLKSSSSPSTKT